MCSPLLAYLEKFFLCKCELQGGVHEMQSGLKGERRQKCY